MIQELLKAFVLIFIAEMGDKTQILAMAFATKYPVKKVLLGIFLGSLLNHGLGVILGSYISNFIPINTIQIVAGFAFVGFSLWTLRSEDEEEEDEKQKYKFGAVLTVALAFFIGELGDKTQLTAITLSIDSANPLAILGGSVLGMIVTGGLGIIVGKKLGDKIPEFAIRLIAASVFMFFGITKLHQTLPGEYLNIQNILMFIGLISIIVIMLLRPAFIRRIEGRESLFRKKFRELYNYYNKIEESIGEICLGTEICGNCQGNNCIVGNTKILIKNGLDERDLLINEEFHSKEEIINKKYDKEKVVESLRMTLEVIKKDPSNDKYRNIHKIRKNLEMILFGKSIEKMNIWNDYSRSLTDIDSTTATRIFKGIDK